MNDRLSFDPISGKWSLRVSTDKWIEWEGDPFDRKAAETLADAYMAQHRDLYPAFKANGQKIYVSIPAD